MKTIAIFLEQEGIPSTESLSSLGLDEGTVIDPFTASEYKVLGGRSEEEQDYYVISAGPNRSYDYTLEPLNYILYDPTNGTVSRGDIVVEVKRK